MHSSQPKIEQTHDAERRDSSSPVAEFYDEFQPRLLRDYVRGNARVSAAIDRVCSHIRPDRQSVLDVGCGIGYTAAEYRARRPWVHVHGVDISPKNVDVARTLFGAPGVSFSVSSLESAPNDAPFDVIALIDVYEHVPRCQWPAFNDVISRCMSSHCVLVLTTPSPFHQQYLARNKPAELQIVDETMQLNDALALRDAIGGTLLCYEYISVWNSNDYLHVVIDRAPCYEPVPAVPAGATSWLRRVRSKTVKENDAVIQARREHVRRLLGIEVQ